MVALGNVEDCASPRGMQPFVTVADKRVWVQFFQVNRDTSNAVSAIDAAEDAIPATELCEALERHADAWLGSNRIVDCDARILATGFDLFDGFLEFGAELGV
jgi:hypothetical protein